MRSDFHSAYQIAREMGLSWVCWRMPFGMEFNTLGPAKAVVWDDRIPEREAFIFAPFDSRDCPKLILGADGAEPHYSSGFIQPPHSGQAEYIQWVNRCLVEIKSGRFQKLVGARVHREVHSPFDPVDHFLDLCNRHPEAFCYFWYSPISGTWLGATPELLLEYSAEHIKTVALAGTQYTDDRPFTGKEEEEQQIVADYILEMVQPFVRELTISNRKQIRSGHLVHLVNEISGIPVEGIISVEEILKVLHPTPAVAGLPRQEAMDFIRAEEGFSRGYYSGFLGPSGQELGSLFVNLRCMQVSGPVQYYYVGAGLTALSDPEKEWQETEEKRKVIS